MVRGGWLPPSELNRWLREAHNCLFQLRINLICDGHDIDEEKAEVHNAQVVLQSVEDADLQYPRFFNNHWNRIALRASNVAVFDRTFGDLFRPEDSGYTQAVNKFSK